MIYYNSNTINDWNFGDDNIIKVYKHGAVCYYKITSGDTPTPVQEPCFAVVDDITQYSDTEFEDVFNKADGKWYKLNNLNQYEEYGVYGDSIASGGTSFQSLQQLIETHTVVEDGQYNRELTPTVSGITHFRLYIPNATTQSSYVYSDLNSDTSTGTTKFAIKGDANGTLYSAVGGYSTIKAAADDSNCQWAYWVDADTIEVDVEEAVGTTIFIRRYQINFPTSFISYYIGEEAATTYEGKLAIVDGYEYIYSGSSWVNVGAVSGSTIDTVWIDPPSTNNQNASFDIGHYWGEGYKMVFNAYLSGSYSGDYGSFWRWNQHTPIEFNFYSNGFYYDFHNPTSTSAPDVATNDYSWRIMKNNTLRNYENSQIFNVKLTNGTVSVKLEETGAEIVNGSTSVSTQSWYNGLYQASLGSMNNQSKCHLSHIQVYNANDELVNDIKFVKNQGVTGAQEISAYDSVLNVTYNNTNSYTPVYHVVEESGGTTYPMYYDEMQDPPNNVSFSSMTEAEEYECPWVGMTATIDGVRYVFSGDSQSGYEWVYNPSRLPQGYTEVEYVENTGTSYFNTNFTPNQDTRVVCDMQLVTASDFPRLWGAGAWNSATGLMLNYEGGYLQMSWLGKTSWTKYTSVPQSFDRKVYDVNKNYLYVDSVQIGSNTYTTRTASDPIGVFTYIGSGRPSSSSYWGQEHFKGKMYSFQIYDNGTLVRDLVPCKRDNDDTVGAYDIVNDVFYTVPSGYTTDKLIAGNPV